MTDHEALQAYLLEHTPHLSEKQTRLLNFILDNLSYVAFASAGEVGRKAGVSAATVVRLCQALGYKGYADFQKHVRETFPSYTAAIERVETIEVADAASLVERVFSLNVHNLSETAQRISQEELEAVVEAIYKARSILVYGAGLSASLSLFLAQSLKILGFPAHTLLSGGLDVALEGAFLDSVDLVIGISFWRYVKDTAQLLRRAKQVGASTIAITDSPVSPIARLADHKFIVITESVSHSISLTAAMSVLDLLIAALLYRDAKRCTEALRRVNSSYEESGSLIMNYSR